MNNMMLLLQQGSSDVGTFVCCLVPILLLIFIIIMIVAQAKELKAIARTSVGKYLAGLPNVGQSAFEIDCAVVGNDFLFIDGIGRELDKIPRDSINQIIVDDKSQITQ